MSEAATLMTSRPLAPLEAAYIEASVARRVEVSYTGLQDLQDLQGPPFQRTRLTHGAQND